MILPLILLTKTNQIIKIKSFNTFKLDVTIYCLDK